MITATDLIDAIRAADARRHPSKQAWGLNGIDGDLANVMIDGVLDLEATADELNKRFRASSITAALSVPELAEMQGFREVPLTPVNAREKIRGTITHTLYGFSSALAGKIDFNDPAELIGRHVRVEEGSKTRYFRVTAVDGDDLILQPLTIG